MLGCRPLNEVEYLLVISRLTNTRDKALFILGCKTGLRITELLSLRVLDFDFPSRRVNLPRRNAKAKQASRSIILHDEAISAILSHINAHGYGPSDYLFQMHPRYQRRQNRSVNGAISRAQAYRVLKQAYRLAGVTGKTGTHSMRKTFANKVYNKLNKDLLKTKVALGHKSIDSTISYLSFDSTEVDAAILS